MLIGCRTAPLDGLSKRNAEDPKLKSLTSKVEGSSLLRQMISQVLHSFVFQHVRPRGWNDFVLAVCRCGTAEASAKGPPLRHIGGKYVHFFLTLANKC